MLENTSVLKITSHVTGEGGGGMAVGATWMKLRCRKSLWVTPARSGRIGWKMQTRSAGWFHGALLVLSFSFL